MSIKKIAFVPGAFRPFGDHHMRMAKHYADTCDEVVLVVSNPKNEESKRLAAGAEITPEAAKEIIDLCLGDSGLGNVTCQVSDDPNPIRTVLGDIAKLKDCEVVLGVSSKDDDPKRFSSIDPRYFEGNGVTILPPDETAFPAMENDGTEVSASDMREHVSDREMLRRYLPAYIEDRTFDRIYDILNGKTKATIDTHDELKAGSQIFRELLEEDDLEEDAPGRLDEEETEFSGIRMDDSSLDDAKCRIIAYNTHVMEDDEQKAYNPKNNPDKAVDIVFDFDDGNEVEIWLDPETKEWDSRVNGSAKLTPDQMGQFFHTDLCRKIDGRLGEMWPESDPYFNGLLEAVRAKKLNIDPAGTVSEDSNVFRKGNIDKEKSREKNVAGRQERTRSGRKLISPSDFDVKHDDNEAYYVWPETGKEFKWSQWADWDKIRPIARMRITIGSFTYGISFSPFLEDDDNRGAKAYNLDLEPKLQYLTPEETREMLKLSVVKRFLRNATKRLVKFTSYSDDEIYERVGRPDKCTMDDIRKTKHVVKNTLKAIRNGRADTYIYD